ncbi:MAG: NADH-quinone oxidoreductase subunit J [Candidatus Marsarchaeota archaeon]|nr:NADH-quinone oxidoreductase subunit J [Candidatus Marsarchaeota archaeon]
MLMFFLFIVLAAIDILLAVSIFVTKHIFHAIIAMINIFIINSILFVMLAQPLLAILQLLIFIGGISIFMLVSVATESTKEIKLSKPSIIIILSMLVIILMGILAIHGFPFLSSIKTEGLGSSYISVELSNNIYGLYMIASVMFIFAVGAAFMIKYLYKNKK